MNGSIKSEVRGHVLIRDDQKIQDVTNGCTPASQQLIMSPQLEIDNVHMTTESSERSIKLNFLSCIDCPIGFQKTEDDAKGCDCVCNAMLEPYVVNCNYKRETITKKDTKAWIAYLNIKNASDYFVYPYCPMDYCLPRDKTVEINLNLTIAIGTLNGLIFYANIVAANQDIFFPSTSFVTVFVSWLNLELGLNTCFFDGMDFYWKTWIQLAFLTYILLLVVLVIITSECSIKFAQIVGKRNPLATFDTLILLSYIKFLHTIILAFSFATLDYPDDSHPVVWWPDATVDYFSGKHIVLWVVVAIIFVAGIFLYHHSFLMAVAPLLSAQVDL